MPKTETSDRRPRPPASRTPAPAGARAAQTNAYLAVLLAWLFPGAGHFYLGRRGRAVTFLVVILTAVVIGVALDGDLSPPQADAPLSLLRTVASMGVGLPYFLLRYGAGFTGDVVAPGFEYGGAFLVTAGLMNLLLLLDAWDIARGRKT